MALLNDQYIQSSYRVFENLGAVQHHGVRLAEPGEVEREDLLMRKLGIRGWGRLYHFRHFYMPGWGDGRGRALSFRALEAFYSFLEKIQFPGNVLPSLFLTDDGGLELCWEDANGKPVQIAFLPSQLEWYRASDEIEDTQPLAEAAKVAELLSAP